MPSGQVVGAPGGASDGELVDVGAGESVRVGDGGPGGPGGPGGRLGFAGVAGTSRSCLASAGRWQVVPFVHRKVRLPLASICGFASHG